MRDCEGFAGAARDREGFEGPADDEGAAKWDRSLGGPDPLAPPD